MNIDKALAEAIRNHKNGNLKNAEEACKKILKKKKNHIEALALLSVIYYGSNRLSKAAKLIQKTILKNNRKAEFHNIQALIFMKQAKYEEAETSLKTAFDLDPDPNYLFNLAECYKNGKKNKEAQYALGSAFLIKGDNREALKNLCSVAEHFPNDAKLYLEIGHAWHNLKQYERAKDAYKRAMEIDPLFAQAYYDLGCAELESKEFVNAIGYFRKFLEFDANNKFALDNLAKSHYCLGGVDQAIRLFRESGTEYSRINIATIIPGSPSASHRDILDARQSLNQIAKTEKMPRGNIGPVNIGYISSFFHRSNWMKPVWPLLNRHDRSKFRIHLFSGAPKENVVNPQEGYIPFESDEFHDIQKLDNARTAELINKCKLDILVDLNGYSDINRLFLFSAYALKPVTVAWFNMYATSGLAGYDYLIGDKYVIDEREKAYYTEKIIELPMSYLTFNVNYSVPDVVPPPCLKNNYITFGTLASQYKITPQMIESWSIILSKCPNAKLIIRNSDLTSENNETYIFEIFNKHHIGRERLELLGGAQHYQFLKTYARIDIALDSFPYNGGTTTTEAIWQGVPVVTFDGDRWASRTSKTLLIDTHLSEYVRKSIDDYISFSIDLANDPESPEILKSMRLKMRKNIRNSRVYNAEAFAKCMEYEYGKILEG